jgi:hypothetical protein
MTAVVQIAVLLATIVAAVVIILVGASRSGKRLIVNAALALVVAVLLNLGTALAVTQGSVIGLACVLGGLATAVVACR